MRFQCSRCHQCFYLESKNPVPCPACGGTLSESGDEAAFAPKPRKSSDTQMLEATLAGFLDEADQVAGQTGLDLQAAPVQPPQPAPQPQMPPPPFSPQQGPGPVQPQQNLPSATALTTGFPTAGWEGARQSNQMMTYYIIGLSVAVVLLIGMVVAFAFSGDKDDEADNPRVAAAAGDGGSGSAVSPRAPTVVDAASPKIADAAPATSAPDAQEAPEGATDAPPKEPAESELEKLRRELAEVKRRQQQKERAADLLLAASRAIDVQNDPATALESADGAIEADPANVDALRIRGRSLARLGRMDEAFEAFDRADAAAREADRDGDAESLCRAAELAQYVANDTARATGYLERALAIEVVSPYVAYARARHLYVRGALDAALREAGALRGGDESFARAAALVGEIRYRQSLSASPEDRVDFRADADEALAAATKRDPGLAHAYVLRARLLVHAGEAGDGFGMTGFTNLFTAEELLKRAAALMPKWADVHTALAGLYLQRGSVRNPSAAVKHATLAVELTGDGNAKTLALLAEALSADGRSDEAAEVILKAIKMDPDTTEYQKALRRYRSEKKGAHSDGER